MQTKQCKKCNTIKNISEFRKNGTDKKTGEPIHLAKCFDCRGVTRYNKIFDGKKICKTCGVDRNISDYETMTRNGTSLKQTCNHCNQSTCNVCGVTKSVIEFPMIKNRTSRCCTACFTNATSKTCKTCNISKDLSEYHVARGSLYGRADSCKSCAKNKRNSLRGVIDGLWYTMLKSTRDRQATNKNMPNVAFTREEWVEIAHRKGIETVYAAYVASGYDPNLKPSADRLNILDGYNEQNIRIVTVKENFQAEYDRRRKKGA